VLAPATRRLACLIPIGKTAPNKDNALLPQQADALTNEKVRAAAIFREYWFRAKNHPAYFVQKKVFGQ